MSWIVATLLSAVVLGFYDIAKKHAVARNAVMPTLLLATLAGSAAFVLLTLLRGDLQTVTTGAPRDFLLIALKSVLVSGSWICVYAAMQTMPISLAAPIRATSPVWTFLGALLLYHELPTPIQAVGMATIFVGYFLFATLGKLEGFSWRSRGMTLILAGTLLGAASSLYDKFLLNSLHLNPTFVQFHFSLGLVVVLGLATLALRGHTPFSWRWTIPVTGLALTLADALYFHAVAQPDSQIAVLALLRRSNILISFGLGGLLFHDVNLRQKALSLLIILIGTLILSLCH